MLEVVVDFSHFIGHFEPISLRFLAELSLLVDNGIHTLPWGFLSGDRGMLEDPVTESRGRVGELQSYVVFGVRVPGLIYEQVQLQGRRYLLALDDALAESMLPLIARLFLS